MITLLKAVRDRLRAAMTRYMRPSDITVTGYIDEPPPAAKLPCITIKDGNVARSDQAGGYQLVTRRVRFCLFVPVAGTDEEDVLIGDKGILVIEEAMHAALDENLLGIPGMQSAAALPDGPESEPRTDKSRDYQRKYITYEYVRQQLRPGRA